MDDKGKSTAATNSEAMRVSGKELFGSESDSDEERRPPTSMGRPATARCVSSGTGTGTGDVGASSSRAAAETQDDVGLRLRNRGRGGYLFANEDGRGAAIDHRRHMADTAWAVQVVTGAFGASSSRAAAETQDVTPFEDGQYVRLRNRGRGGYLFANEDGRGVSIDHRRHMANTAWAVQVLTARVLLRGAYGRYLSATASAARSGHIGGYVAQCILEFPDDHHIEWSVTRGKRGSVVLLHATDGAPCALRANGRYRRWNKGVSYGCLNLNSISSMLEWEVQVIPLTVERPPYQPRPPNAAIRWPEGCLELVAITFSHAWFSENGRIEHGHWIQMRLNGRSLNELGNEIANRSGVRFENMTLCVQAGDLGRPVPLLTDLPLRDDPTIILAFMVNSPGYNALRFPDLAAE